MLRVLKLRLGAEQGELDVAAVREDRGFDVLIRGVDRSQKLVCLRLRDHGSFECALGNEARRQSFAQPGQAFGVEEGLALTGRPGNEHDELAVTRIERVEK